MTPDIRITLAPVDPVADVDLIHGWVTQERAEFWGMREKSREEVGEIYRYIDAQEHLSAHLASWHGTPWALFGIYDPFVDEIGEYYDRQPGDVGVHLFLAGGPRPPGLTRALIDFLPRWLFSDPRHQRLVLEPDIRNEKSIAFLHRMGARPGPVVELPGKTAQFVFLDREWSAGQVADGPQSGAAGLRAEPLRDEPGDHVDRGAALG